MVNGRNCLDRLDFEDDEIFDQQIDPVAKFELCATIYNGQSNLSRRSNTRLEQLVLQARLVSTLKQARPNSE